MPLVAFKTVSAGLGRYGTLSQNAFTIMRCLLVKERLCFGCLARKRPRRNATAALFGSYIDVSRPMRTELLRFNGALERDPAIDDWMREHAGELGAIAHQWFEVMR